MKTPSPGGPPRKPRRRWRWHVPPALLHGAETLEGAEILEEVTGAVGLLLWQATRDVGLWSRVPPEERASLFAPGAHERQARALEAAGLDAALYAPLQVIAGVLRDPEGTREEDVLAACRQVSQYYEERDLLGTAIAFATAAALATPANAAMGYRVGLIARKKAEYARAETWFRRTIGLGRQAKDWASYAEAFLGLGNLYIQRGNYPAARRFHIRALRAARRHGMRDIQGRALHDLFVIGVDSGGSMESLEYARGAFRAYGSTHPRLPALAHDIAFFWMTRGRFAPALTVFQAMLPHLKQPSEQLMGWGNVARAAGGAGDRTVFDEAWDRSWSMAHENDSGLHAPQALLDLAHGATSLSDWSRAERAAEAARGLAERREENRVALAAEAVLDAVARRKGVELEARPPEGDEAEATEVLAADLVRSLRETASAAA
ncbi:MAG TPA: tetratricopeptide repeat protein [Longimicrobiaceae bacterium]|nr:tetratricopeptide repeat protein [Longimicrobiaceae bacterium]